jgi:tetratricopeptide (TPR) repeat protein
MKRTAYLGSPLLLILMLLVPRLGWAQADVDAYTAFYAEENAARKIAMGEKFLADFKTSQYGEPVFLTIVPLFAKANNWAKVIEYVDKLEQTVPQMKPNNKAVMYAQGMTAAQQSNNAAKAIAFGEKVLTVAPGDVNTLVTLSSTIPRTLPPDAAGKRAALQKAQEYATKALTELPKLQAKDLGLSEADWSAQRTATEGTIRSTLGEIYFHQADYEKAVTELTTASKSSPKDPNVWMFLGLSLDQQYNGFAKNYNTAFKAMNDAIKEKKDKFQIEELAAQAEALQATATAKRGEAIQALASAVAFGAQQVRPRLEALYKAQHQDSLDGLDRLIQSKKGSER